MASGKVTFYDEATVLGTGSLTNGVSTFGTILVSSGTHSLRAAYLGDSTFASSTSRSVTQIVNAVAAAGFLAPLNYTGNIIPGGSTVADFNGDGVVDLFTSSGVLLGNGDGTFRQGPTTVFPVSLGSAVIADFNLDGKADVVISSIRGPAYALEMAIRRIPVDTCSSAVPYRTII
jgi:hypothetical protein